MTPFGSLWFAWICSREEQSGHALFPKLSQPTADSAVRYPERVRLFFRRSLPGQAGGNRVISLLNFLRQAEQTSSRPPQGGEGH
jgi:hypothetical protein